MREERDFWTRRRAAVAAEEKADGTARAEASAAEERARLEQMSDADLLEALDLPEPESLSSGADFSAFMQQAVPERLRRRALRALWRTNPVLANVDGLVDYGADFTDKATVVENLQTAYQVGKGMLAHLEKLSVPVAEPPDEAPAADVAHEPPDPEPSPAEEPVSPEPDMEEEQVAASPAPRRMVFAYGSECG